MNPYQYTKYNRLKNNSRHLLLVAEYFGPNLQVAVPGHEEEVIVDELLADGLLHAQQGVVLAGQVALQLGEGVLHQ